MLVLIDRAIDGRVIKTDFTPLKGLRMNELCRRTTKMSLWAAFPPALSLITLPAC